MQSLRPITERPKQLVERNPTATLWIVISLTVITLVLLVLVIGYWVKYGAPSWKKSSFDGNVPPMIPETITAGPQGAGILKALPRQIEGLRETFSATPAEMALGIAGRPLTS